MWTEEASTPIISPGIDRHPETLCDAVEATRSEIKVGRFIVSSSLGGHIVSVNEYFCNRRFFADRRILQ